MGLYTAAKLILTLECEESTRLVSEGLDRRLTLSERWAIRLHSLACWSCRRFHRQLHFIHEAGRQRTDLDLDVHRLTPDARARIEALLREHREG